MSGYEIHIHSIGMKRELVIVVFLLKNNNSTFSVSVYALAQLYQVDGDITGIARQGSGSACRSILGGFVRWHQGSASDGSDSIASQIVPESHWPDLRVLILVVM